MFNFWSVDFGIIDFGGDLCEIWDDNGHYIFSGTRAECEDFILEQSSDVEEE